LDEGENEDDKWITVEGRSKTKKLLKPKLETTLHNAFAILSQPNDPIYYMSETISLNEDDKTIMPTDRKEHRLKRRAARRQHLKLTLQRLKDSEELFFDNSITQAEDERTTMAKNDNNNARRLAIDAAHAKQDKPRIGLVQQGRNTAYAFGSALKRQFKSITKNKHVSFAKHHMVRQFDDNITCVMVDYDSGADGHYISEEDRCKAGLPILRASTKKVGVANGGKSKATYVTQLPFHKLSAKANKADTFKDFTSSLMSVGKTSDDGTISVFTKDGVTVHKEEDVLITCKGEPILIGVRDMYGRYRIPLIQQRGQWQPRRPTKRQRKHLQQANSVYDLPSTEQAIKWMHAVCGYPVKSTWLKAVKAGNYVGWPMLTEHNVKKYYPETIETAKGHLNQTRKNVRSTRSRMENCDTSQLKGKKVRDVYTTAYDVRETMFSDQTGQYPTRSQRGNKYIMVMVEIDSNAILVEPMKSRKDAEMIRAYDALLLRLKRAGIVPKKHVLDNEVSENMKNHIRDTCKLNMELVPPGCHRRNAAEVAIRNFKAHFLSVLAGVADDFPPSLWDRLLPQTEITVNLIRQSNATPNVSAYAHLSGPFDYNKMPLAPMGCNAQVHEKTDKRGTWAYHSVDGWYLFTSPEHYRTHTCHIKHTKSERLSDTVQFQHKRITNPTITHADKVMLALAECVKAIKGLTGQEKSSPEATDLQRIVDATRAMMIKQPQRCEEPIRDNEVPLQAALPRVPAALPRVQAALPRVPTANQQPTINRISEATRRERSRKRRVGNIQRSTTASDTTPRARTRSQVATAATRNAPPAMGTRSRSRPSGIPPPTSRTGSALAAKQQRRLRRGFDKLTKRVSRMENEIHQAMAVMDNETGQLLNYRQLMRSDKHKHAWGRSSANEFGRLAQGIGGRIKGTNTIEFIFQHEVPKGRMKDVTYGQFVCTVRPEKEESNRTRFTVGGDRINYPGAVATPTAEMLVAKMLFNSVISTTGARFMTMDISNFYLNTPLPRPEFIRINLKDIPEEVIIEYNLRKKATANGSIYIRAKRGMYGLPQAGLLANELLEKRLNKHGYHQSKLVPGLWKHDTRPIQFTLVVDDFGVKYVGEEHANHLKATLEEHYKLTCDWTGQRYIGITLDWDYKRRQVHLSMPNYVKKALKQFQHKVRKLQNAPYPSAPIQYGAKKQYATQNSSAPLVDAKTKKFIQQVCGKFLFLGRAVDSTLLCPISAIASQSAAPTTDTLENTMKLLDYLGSQEEAVLSYHASDMIVAVHSDASYLSEPGARSRAGGHFFLSSDTPIPPNNGAVLNIAHIIKNVMSSATEAELAGLYIMAREAVYIRIILEELGHKQPPTPLQTDNAMAEAVINGKVQPKRTKAMDMRFHWLRDRECQQQFRIYWRPGKMNYADYWTKHHPEAHHRNIRKEFLTPHIVIEMLRIEQQQKKYASNAA
jgi:hypothetical protein